MYNLIDEMLAALIAAEGAIMEEVNAAVGEDHPFINAHAKIAAKARAVIAKAKNQQRRKQCA